LTNVIISRGQVRQMNGIKIDTSKTAILQIDPKAILLDSTLNQLTLTQDELQTIDSLLIACVNDYNSRLDIDDKQEKIDLKKYDYKKQLIVGKSKEGDKKVWVNCFCNTWSKINWRTEIIRVNDGGNCYFNFTIDLTTKTFYDLRINGNG
jgi:hypothetical protein